jgi:hypothetical protein
VRGRCGFAKGRGGGALEDCQYPVRHPIHRSALHARSREKEPRLTIRGLISPQLHATPHLRVFPPCTNSLTAQLPTPFPFRVSTMVLMLLYLPSILVYHCTRSFKQQLSSIMRVTKATSPPGVTISTSAPVQAECGGRDFAAAEARRSAGEA